jgi:drug/metabolite transporter (DMT)-like permease
MTQTIYFGMCYVAFLNGVAAGTVALVMSLQPILVALIAPRWTAERVSYKQWVGLLLPLAGTAILIVARSQVSAATVVGLFAAFGALAGMTLAMLSEKRFGVLRLLFWLETPQVQ